MLSAEIIMYVAHLLGPMKVLLARSGSDVAGTLPRATSATAQIPVALRAVVTMLQIGASHQISLRVAADGGC
jgi:hypothetical protein